MTDEKTLIDLQREHISVLEEHVKTLKEVISVKDETLIYLKKTIELDETIIKNLSAAFKPSLN
jgi:hypothetical protein